MSHQKSLVVEIIEDCGGASRIAEAVCESEGKYRSDGFVRAWPRSGAIPTRYNAVLIKLGGGGVKAKLRELADLK